ncbi:solute carrier organic anion transporter family member 1B1-like isoform X1 [Leptidea sinapis]|uniref:solute carrier organic anion transporter family member 1B1-like isoform X1 n=1 Tax=Leptidea sinapis TaxID=189913 RepID=UPI002134266A|nr:solute carrier organic anion transporter family member 1B1-like isoform X1 [Leptidea sinapis]XP_050679535.1 solute carrier organic anion transporter family member 1B1-like isoform X1 [Leptidea sinapis]
MSCLNTCYNKVKSRIQSWANNREFVPQTLRKLVFGNLITITIAEAAAYRIIIQDVRTGNLPHYMPYLLLTLFAMLEAIAAPIVGWLGYRNRRRMLLGWSWGLFFICFTLFFIPSPTQLDESELCSSTKNTIIKYTGVSAVTAVRLSIVLFTATCFLLTRVATWSHYLAYTDEYAPERSSVHVGILVISRIIPGIFGFKMLTVVLEKSIIINAVILTMPLIVQNVQMHFAIPSSSPEVGGVAKASPSLDDRDFFTSLRRVLFNFIAMSQMVALGLMAAAFFGFSYHEEALVHARYNIVPGTETVTHFPEFFRYIPAILGVVYVGVKHSVPILPEFDFFRGVKHIIKMTVIAFVMYIVVVSVPSCSKGQLAGLDGTYQTPICSSSCGCVPSWNAFSPVCVVDTMTTFASPCEAGCTTLEDQHGISVYTNCSCAATSGRAVAGACGDHECQPAYQLHLTLYSIIVAVSALAFQTQIMMILKSVDPRDKSIAIGMMWAMIATVAYVFGNSIFYAITSKACHWFTWKKCQLYNEHFPYMVGFTCASFVFISLLVNLASLGYLKTKFKCDSRNAVN